MYMPNKKESWCCDASSSPKNVTKVRKHDIYRQPMQILLLTLKDFWCLIFVHQHVYINFKSHFLFPIPKKFAWNLSFTVHTNPPSHMQMIKTGLQPCPHNCFILDPIKQLAEANLFSTWHPFELVRVE